MQQTSVIKFCNQEKIMSAVFLVILCINCKSINEIKFSWQMKHFLLISLWQKSIKISRKDATKLFEKWKSILSMLPVSTVTNYCIYFHIPYRWEGISRCLNPAWKFRQPSYCVYWFQPWCAMQPTTAAAAKQVQTR